MYVTNLDSDAELCAEVVAPGYVRCFASNAAVRRADGARDRGVQQTVDWMSHRSFCCRSLKNAKSVLSGASFA